jgi:hypothetical protein
MTPIKFTNSLIVVAMGALSLMLLSGDALATRITPATSATPVSPANAGCIGLFFGGFQNQCGSTIDVIVPLDADSAGAKTASVTVIAPSPSQTVGCTFIATDQNITVVRSSGQHFPTAFGASATQIPLTISGGSFANGPIYVECNVGSLATLYTVGFNQ